MGGPLSWHVVVLLFCIGAMGCVQTIRAIKLRQLQQQQQQKQRQQQPKQTQRAPPQQQQRASASSTVAPASSASANGGGSGLLAGAYDSDSDSNSDAGAGSGNQAASGTASGAGSGSTSGGAAAATASELPADFFDGGAATASTDVAAEPEQPQGEPAPTAVVPQAVPKGFFDDEAADAKARQVRASDEKEAELKCVPPHTHAASCVESRVSGWLNVCWVLSACAAGASWTSLRISWRRSVVQHRLSMTTRRQTEQRPRRLALTGRRWSKGSLRVAVHCCDCVGVWSDARRACCRLYETRLAALMLKAERLTKKTTGAKRALPADDIVPAEAKMLFARDADDNSSGNGGGDSAGGVGGDTGDASNVSAIAAMLKRKKKKRKKQKAAASDGAVDGQDGMLFGWRSRGF